MVSGGVAVTGRNVTDRLLKWQHEIPLSFRKKWPHINKNGSGENSTSAPHQQTAKAQDTREAGLADMPKNLKILASGCLA